MALVVEVLLPVRPAIVLDGGQAIDERVGREDVSDLRIWRCHNRRFCARRQ